MKHTRTARFLTVAAAFVALGALSAGAYERGFKVVTCYSSPATTVPDAGSMIPLLGMSLIAVDALRRKLRS